MSSAREGGAADLIRLRATLWQGVAQSSNISRGQNAVARVALENGGIRRIPVPSRRQTTRHHSLPSRQQNILIRGYGGCVDMVTATQEDNNNMHEDAQVAALGVSSRSSLQYLPSNVDLARKTCASNNGDRGQQNVCITMRAMQRTMIYMLYIFRVL